MQRVDDGCTLMVFAITVAGVMGIMVANHPPVLKTLAVDLLNPTPQAEARKHKLKVNKTSTVNDQEAWKN